MDHQSGWEEHGEFSGEGALFEYYNVTCKVCLLHEYVQQSLKTQPFYSFTELDNAATPYAATVKINAIEYGRGTGSSKKIAKSEAARYRE